jgi:hypothetical protein
MSIIKSQWESLVSLRSDLIDIKSEWQHHRPIKVIQLLRQGRTVEEHSGVNGVKNPHLSFCYGMWV